MIEYDLMFFIWEESKSGMWNVKNWESGRIKEKFSFKTIIVIIQSIDCRLGVDSILSENPILKNIFWIKGTKGILYQNHS